MIIEVTANSLVACDRCHGKGTVDNFSGGFTGGDMDEWYGDDWDSRDEFVESYSRGAYDKACPVCNGNKVVSIFVCDECGEERVPMESDFHSSDVNICGYCIPYEPEGW